MKEILNTRLDLHTCSLCKSINIQMLNIHVNQNYNTARREPRKESNYGQ